MPWRETQFGQKYIMLLTIDLNETLGLCYLTKKHARKPENLTEDQKEKIRDPMRNYLTLFGNQ